ncbi:MAG: tetratricopeptide repeat protein [Tolypothrix carrinoi HA7290-LM1]|nr:tetratricopeptide repeat protein [Tolypothrix carrinoi HA7290-LM1]
MKPSTHKGFSKEVAPVRLEKRDAQTWAESGCKQCQAANYKVALASCKRAIEIDANNYLAWINQACVLNKLERYEEAIASYDKAIEIKPDFDFAWCNRGMVLFNLGRFYEAIASWDKAIEIKPDCDLAWYNRGMALEKLGQFEEAIASDDKAIQIKPDYDSAWNNRGVALEKLGQFEEAIASYDKAIQIKPNYYDAWYNRGVALGNLGQFEEAIASYDKAIEIKPNYYDAWNNRGVALERLGRFEKAIASYDKAIEIKSHLYFAWLNRGVVLGNLAQYEEAIASYDKAIEIKPDCDLAWYNRGVALEKLGQFEEAIASYDKAIEIKPDFDLAWLNRGVALERLGRFEEAIASEDKAIEIKPDFDLAWLNRGVALERLGRFEEAIASEDKAIEIKPDFDLAWLNRGVALEKLGQFEEAIASYDKAIKIKPNYYDAWNNRGVALERLGRFEEAIASEDKAIQIKPDFDSAWHNRGIALGNLGRFEEAIASWDKAIEIKPNHYDTWHNRGIALGNLGRFEEAIVSEDKAIEIKPDFDSAWHNRGIALGNLGRFEEAIASWDKAIEIKPNHYDTWNNRGVALERLGRFEEAIASEDKAIEIKPDFDLAWCNRGNALLNLGCYEEAIASFDKAIEIKPDFDIAWLNWGFALGNLGRFEEAIASFDKAIAIKPDFDLAWNGRGAVLCDHLQRYEDAIASFDKAIEIKPDFDLAWLNRGIAAEKSVTYNPPSLLIGIVQRNLTLNQRGYEGKLASYEEGLKYCQQDTHPEGWGKLHQAIGNAHYFRGRGNSYPRTYWYKAVINYNQALKTLTEADFPELHLEVLRELIGVQLDLQETAKAEELQRRGTDFLRRLLSEANRSDKSKKQLALKFAGFQQLTVDLAVQSGNLVQAVELAEQGKNACLSWLLSAWSDDISSPSYLEMQRLLNPTTAVVYWHISPYALHTFILKHNALSPIVLGETRFLEEVGLLSQTQRLREFEDWVKKWNEQYADYRKGKDKQTSNLTPQPPSLQGKGEKSKPLSLQERGLERGSNWRDNLPEMLRQLGNILDIPAIVNAIDLTPQPPSLRGKGEQDSPPLAGEGLGERSIQNLILVPHRDLHRFPLHALFGDRFTITYLPSAQIGLIPSTLFENKGYERDNLLSIEHPNSKGYPSLEFAQIESEAINRMFFKPTRFSSKQATKEALITALPEKHSIFHFTGHGEYNFHNPALSHLALAGEDKLTLIDICNFDLRSYRLVSLAACESAIAGNHTITTEYVGLVSGFMSCGVAHVVSTLWTVESAASALVMIQFYHLLQQEKSEIVALAKATQWLRNVTNAKLAEWYAAQIARLHEDEGIVYRFLSRHLNYINNTTEPNNKPYNHPYFWAAFTITGNFESCNL